MSEFDPVNGDLFDTLGEAKDAAELAVLRDGCAWYIYKGGNYYRIYDQFASNYSDGYYKLACTVRPIPIQAPAEAVMLTPTEKALVAAVLDPKEPGRDYYPGDEKTKVSLWKKLTGGKEK